MSLQVSQYAVPVGGTLGANQALSGSVPLGQPLAAGSVDPGQSVTVGGSGVSPRLVRLLALSADLNIAWTGTGPETLKQGVPEFRYLAPGTLITCAAAS